MTASAPSSSPGVPTSFLPVFGRAARHRDLVCHFCGAACHKYTIALQPKRGRKIPGTSRQFSRLCGRVGRPTSILRRLSLLSEGRGSLSAYFGGGAPYVVPTYGLIS